MINFKERHIGNSGSVSVRCTGSENPECFYSVCVLESNR